MNGSIASSSLLQLNVSLAPSNFFPAIVGGSGVVPKIVSYGGGHIAPGSSPGRLTVQGDFVLSNDTVRVELNGATPGSGYDQIRVNGGVMLGSSQLELALGFTPAPDETFIIISNDGVDPVQGTFLGRPQGSYFNSGDTIFYIEYNSGEDDNDVGRESVLGPAPAKIGSIAPQAELMVIQGEGMPGATYVLESTPHVLRSRALGAHRDQSSQCARDLHFDSTPSGLL